MRSDAMLEVDILAAVLHDARLVPSLMRFLEEDDFATAKGKRLYAAILGVAKRDGNDAVTAMTVRDELRRMGEPEQEVLQLLDPLIGEGMVGSFEPKCRRLRDLRRHRLIETGLADINQATDVEQAQAALLAMVEETSRLSSRYSNSLGEVLDELLDEKERELANEARIRTGLPTLDTHLAGGLAPGWLCVIGARTGVGKTTLAVQIAASALLAGHRVVYFALEETRTQIAERVVRHIAKARRVRSGEMDALFNAALRDDLRSLPLVLKTEGTIDAIIGAIGEHSMETEGIGLVVVDYVGLVRTRRGRENRVQEVSEITARLKTAAMEFRVPIIAVAQVNRSPMARTDKSPQLSDLRDSGSLEQDGDVVILLHRPDELDPRSGALGLSKNRYGPPTGFAVRFDYAIGHVMELLA